MSKRDYRAAFGRALGSAAAARMSMSFNPSFTYTKQSTSSYATGGPAGGVKFSREKHLVGKRRRSNRVNRSDLFRVMPTIRARWQLCSNTLTGPGRIPIGFGGYTTTDINHHSMPVHFMSLTQLPFSPVDAIYPGKGCYAHGLYRVIRNVNTGEFGYQYMESNTNAGVNNYDVAGHWQPEQTWDGYSFTGSDQWDTLFHKWSEIKLNLYGAKHIPLTYTINIVQMPKNYNPHQYPPDSVTTVTTGQPEFSEFSRWMEDINRSLLCNPINTTGTDKEYKRNIRVLKSYKINLQPLSYTNAEAEGTASVKVGNVRQFKIFMRHDRFRNYVWAEKDTNVTVDRNFADLGWDVIDKEEPVTDVTWKQRVYMFISCTTGPIRDGPQNDVKTHQPIQLTDIPEDYGSYDIIVRNEFKATK